MPTLIRLRPGAPAGVTSQASVAEDAFITLGEADPVPETGGVVLPLARLVVELEELGLDGRKIGALVTVDDDLDRLLPHLPRLAVVALRFDKYRDGRSYTTAVLLRSRHGFTGELRAVGDVLVEEATQMIRCGFDSFSVADESSAQQWMAKAQSHRHVYQTAPDGRIPAFAERASSPAA